MEQKYIVAVSGGVDSVVLLDIVVKRGDCELVVAHFDHGMRNDSAEDTEFVRQLAISYGLPFETEREELGGDASEETARRRRYAFLSKIASRHSAKIVTAHHLDDVVETIAINLVRSTGWRGLAVFDASDIYRPILTMSKRDILSYASENNLNWREDHTNTEQKYLRNRLRLKLQNFDNGKQEEIIRLWKNQLKLKQEIEAEIESLGLISEDFSRYLFIMIDESVAIECIRHITKAKLTRPQMRGCLLAIKTAKPNSVYTAGSNIELQFSSRFFKVKMLK